MGDIPIDNADCYVKYKFPADMRLTNGPAAQDPKFYVSSAVDGEKMLHSPANGIYLAVDTEYFVNKQAYEQGNYIVLKGCQEPAVVGTGQVAKVKFEKVFTPDAVKTTANFEVSVYKDFNSITYALTDLIISGTGTIPATAFTSGQVLDGVFGGLLDFI